MSDALDRLVFALDVADPDDARALAQRLTGELRWIKVATTLFTKAGPGFIGELRAMGYRVFLDLKFHDIPATVAAAAREVARQRARMFTVHALGGSPMIQRAARELQRMTLVPGVPPPMILGVTLLTSHSEADLAEIGLAPPLEAHSVRLAKLAVASGASGVVASAREVPMLRAELPPETVFVTPGIRASGASTDDQARVVTAREAILAGATYLVVGRPIRDAADPVDMAKRIVDEIGSAEAS